MCQALANTAWSFATCAHRDLPLFGAIARLALQKLKEFDQQDATARIYL